MAQASQLIQFPSRSDGVDSSAIPPHTISHGDGNGGGGDMLEARVAKLEANVEDIKSSVAELKADFRDLRNTSASTSRDVAVILQKQIDIDASLSKKPSVSDMNTAISAAVNKQIMWTVATGLAILGLAKFIF